MEMDYGGEMKSVVLEEENGDFSLGFNAGGMGASMEQAGEFTHA